MPRPSAGAHPTGHFCCAPEVPALRHARPGVARTVTERIISGSTVDRIPMLTFPDFPIDLPDIESQRRIADVLAAIDDLIENNRRRVELLEEMGRAIYREWFVRFRYPGHEDGQLVDSPHGPVPEGWDASTLGDGAGGSRAARRGRLSSATGVDRFPGSQAAP